MNLQRTQYIDWLMENVNNTDVKIIHGLRGVGKTILMKELFYFCLISAGVRSDSFIHIDAEYLAERYSPDSETLQKYIDNRIRFGLRYRIIIDEPQYINGYEKVVENLRNEHDIYLVSSFDSIANSNIKNTSVIQVLPLSIVEYAACLKTNIKSVFDDYTRYGSYPSLVYLNNDQKAEKLAVLRNSILKKDIYDKYGIRNKTLFRAVLRYLINNQGDYVSAYAISEEMKKNGYEKATDDTVASYISYLTDSHIFQKVNRYDIKKDSVLKTKNKYYLTDAMFGYLKSHTIDIQQTYENIVCIELIRRGFTLYAGKNNDKEIKFVAIKNNYRYYLQVSETLTAAREKEEITPFRGLDDGYKKIVITTDDVESGSLMFGYKHMNIWEFLSNDNSLDMV
jgi:predicted AAA+ superfamily ATPase